jgi:hypothetical protein
LEKDMTKRWLIPLMILMLLLAACSGAEAEASLAEVPEAEAPAGETSVPQGEPVESSPTATSAPTQKAVSEGLQMECTLVSNQPDAPAELSSILGVKEGDWVSGPETAAVTIVEYSDFQ